jgi:hypothetical protein
MGLHPKSSLQQEQQQQQQQQQKEEPLKTRAGTSLAELAKYIPLRLSANERVLLAVLEQTLHVSEYTDHVDVTSSRRGIKARRILDGLLEVCHIATGLVVASGQERALTSSGMFDLPHNNNSSSSSTNHGILPTFRLKKKKNSKKSKKKADKKKSSKRQKDVESNGDEEENDNDDDDGDVSSTPTSWANRDPKENATFFQTMFEIGRRNKVLNPSSMRNTYGKLMYILQDAQNPTVAKSLGFSLHKDLLLVGSFLEQYEGGVALLHDKRLVGATQFVQDRDPTTGARLDRTIVDQTVAEKRRLTEELVKDYASHAATNTTKETTTTTSASLLSENVIRRCIDSISDAIVYVDLNVAPVEQMLQQLEENFDPNQVANGFSLELRGSSRSSTTSSTLTSFSQYGRYGLSAYGSSGNDGPTLSHSHATQFVFVWQSLRLWCKVMRNMHRLWVCADEDLLSTTTSYQLFNTGQGLNRVQSCPRVAKVMRALLNATQEDAGANWVGLSVIHLGDRDVPNALIFIDKYTQIPRFLDPIVIFLRSIPEVCNDERINAYIKEHFGSQEKLKLTVLADYFKHGFDGSGDDGGSCIDGRLTSSWNWTSKVAKKPYYHTLMLSGFRGFDGDFK